MNILVLNAGSSSFKSSLYRFSGELSISDSAVPLWTGQIDWNSSKIAVFKIQKAAVLFWGNPRIKNRQESDNSAEPTSNTVSVREERFGTTRSADIEYLLSWLWSGKTQVISGIEEIDIVGHRVVHGGDKYSQPTLINPEVKAEIDRILNSESGLLGVSGVSNDLREIDKAIELGNIRAKLALDIYIDRLAAKIAAFLPNLGGVDALIFTAGVGENHAGIRAAVAAKLAFLGVEIDPTLNELPIPSDCDLATAQSQVRLLVIHTQEEWQIAQACCQYLRSISG